MLRGLLRCQQSSLGFFGAGTFDGSDLCVIQCPIVFGGVGMADQGAGEAIAARERTIHIRDVCRDRGGGYKRSAAPECTLHVRHSIRDFEFREISVRISAASIRLERVATVESRHHTRDTIRDRDAC